MKHQIRDGVILITGATGTFGRAFLQRCLELEAKEIRVFSRDEKKQHELKQTYKKQPNIKFYIGDIRDCNAVDRAMLGVDYVFHAAAMKQIPSCEANPLEAIKTNILGSENVLNSAIRNNVKKVVLLSTDKAVYPTSTMGITKACMEKIALAKAMEQTETEICITRFCNLISSNGSVVPLFINQIKNNQPLTITDLKMQRYFMSIKEAVYIVEKAFEEGQTGEIFIKKAKPCTIEQLGRAILRGFNIESYPIEIIGIRSGEKMRENLWSEEEKGRIKQSENYLVITNKLQDSFVYTDELMSQEDLDVLLNTIMEI